MLKGNLGLAPFTQAGPQIFFHSFKPKTEEDLLPTASLPTSKHRFVAWKKKDRSPKRLQLSWS